MTKFFITVLAEDLRLLIDMSNFCIGDSPAGDEHKLKCKNLVNKMLDKLGEKPQYTEKGNYIYEGFDYTEDDD